MGLFEDRAFDAQTNKTTVPVWFMRQAGRYHQHYQNIRKNSDFMTMCKNPELAKEITLGPLEEFNFDAAILFSDLLFPLEFLNFGLSYDQGPPTLERHLKSTKDLDQISLKGKASDFFAFQKNALRLLKDVLPSHKTLLGFVGAPFTLYTYAVEGSHSGQLKEAKLGLYDGRFEGFLNLLLPPLLENMKLQAEGGADAICLFDTAGGELSLGDYKNFIIPSLKYLTKEFKKVYPQKKIVYYSKYTHLDHLLQIEDENIDVLGVDWRMDLRKALQSLGKDYYVQGNLDPAWLFLPWPQLQTYLEEFFKHLNQKDLPLSKWIFGLGHGVLVGTPEINVKKTVQFVHESFKY